MPDAFLTTNVARLAGSTWCSLFALGLSASVQCEQMSLAPPEGSAFLGVIDAQPTATNQIEVAAAMRTTGAPPSIMLATLELDGIVAAAAGARAPEPFSGSTAAEVILQGDLLVGAFPGAANGGAVIVWGRLGPGASVQFLYWYMNPAGPPGGNFSNSRVVTFCG